MRKIRVGITSIGSGVGQAVANSCRLSRLDIAVVGYGNNPLAYGIADCDEHRLLPSIYDLEYLNELCAACKADRIDILIPGLDDELLLLARNIDLFSDSGTLVVVSSERIVLLCRNKVSTENELASISNAIVRSYTKSSLMRAAHNGQVNFPLIVKPSSGAASRGVFIIHEEAEISKVDDSHVIQEIALPRKLDPNREKILLALQRNALLQLSEFSAQVVIGRNAREIGRFLSCNGLKNGVPVEIVPLYSPEIWAAIDGMLPYFLQHGHIGPINFQGRLTDEGPRIFEINARFTGISGLRALSGFNEVEALISDLTSNESDKKNYIQQNMRKIGFRQVADRVLDFEYTQSLTSAVESSGGGIQARPGKCVLVTGGNSYLGRAVLASLLQNSAVDTVFAMVRDPTRFSDGREPALPENVEIVDAKTLYVGGPLGRIDVICHLASGRPYHNEVELADALRFSQMLTTYAIQNQIPVFINASSQAVYGTKRSPKWCEELPPAPETAFAQAKLAVELMVESIPLLNAGSKSISLRLAQLIGPSPVLDNDRIVHKFIKAVLAGDNMKVLGGEQKLDFLDHRDAAALISYLVSTSLDQCPSVLNVTSKTPVSVLELAQCVAKVSAVFGLPEPVVEVDPDYTFPDFAMDGSKAFEITGWMQTVTLEKSIFDIFNDNIAKPSITDKVLKHEY